MVNRRAGLQDVIPQESIAAAGFSPALRGSLPFPAEWSRYAADLTSLDRDRPGRDRPFANLRPLGILLRESGRRPALQPALDRPHFARRGGPSRLVSLPVGAPATPRPAAGEGPLPGREGHAAFHAADVRALIGSLAAAQ